MTNTTVSRIPVPSHLRIQVSPLCGPERHFWIHPHLTTAILAWSMDPLVCHPDGAFEYIPVYGNETSQVGRNKACREFLSGNMDYLLMVDNDTIPMHPETGAILNLMAMAYWGRDVVGALVPTIKTVKGQGKLLWAHNAYVYEGDGYRALSLAELMEKGDGDLQDDIALSDARPPLKKVDAVGFGAVMLSRRIVEDLIQCGVTWPTGPLGNGSPKRQLLPHEEKAVPILRERNLDGSTSFGEDMLACRRAVDMGYLVYTAPSLYCDHAHTLDMAKLPTMTMAGRPDPNSQGNPIKDGSYVIPAPNAPTPADYGLAHRVPPDYPPLPPITNYSIEPALANYLRRQITQHNDINNVLELGSGISTVVMAEALAKGHSRRNPGLLSIDHDGDYLDQIVQSMTIEERLGSVWWEVAIGPDGFYELEWRINGLYDLLLIDGPPGKYNGRRHAHRLFNQVREGGLVILDDCDRPDEKRAIQRWYKEGWLIQQCRVGRAMVMVRTGVKVELPSLIK